MTEVLERLNDQLRPVNAPENPEEGEREPWRVRTQDDAAWASRKARDAHQEVKAIDEWEQREIERVRAAAESERKRPRQTAEFFEAALGTYVMELAREGRAKKSLELPGGTIKIRKRQPEITMDEEKAIPWLRENDPDLLRVKESVDKSALRKAVKREEGVGVVHTSTGEVIAWMDLTEQPDSASFTPAEES